MKIVIINTHSILNSGDSGIILAQIKWLRSYFPDAEFTLTSKTPELDRKFYKKTVTTILPPIIPAPSIYSGRFNKSIRTLINLLSLRSKVKFIQITKNCDLVISSGGGYFWTNRKSFPGPMFFQNYWHIKLATILNKPIIFFPQSFGPFSNKAAVKLLGKMLMNKNITKILPRESISSNLLYDLIKTPKDRRKIEICPDITFLLTKKPCPRDCQLYTHYPRPLIALTLRHWDFPETANHKEKKEKQMRYFAALEKFCLDFYLTRGSSFIIYPQSRGPGDFENDRSISKIFFNKVKNKIPASNLLYEELPDDVSPHEIIHLLSHTDCAITTRFHSAIFALIAGTPAISINYQPKSTGIMQQLGFDHLCLDIKNLDSKKIKVLTDEILKHKDNLLLEIEDKLRKTRKTIKHSLRNTMKNMIKN